jgi:DNA invertase Pin-like site-specific DNA recombinase
MMTSSNALPEAVLKRKAVVYVRQSTQTQVQTNLESQRRRYELLTLHDAAAFETSK